MLAPGGADASVRAARPGDVVAMGAVQVRAWRRAYPGLLPEPVLAGLAPDAVAERWRAAVTSPPSARHAVLVACAGATVVGLAALAPATDRDAAPGDAELVALEVDPAQQRRGHASRLLAAAVDAARERAFTALQVWVPAADDARRAFLQSAGLRPDGAHRRLGTTGGTTGSTEVSEVRLSAAL